MNDVDAPRAEAGWGALARGWNSSGAEWNTPVARRLVSLAELRPGMTVLDAGCGTGAVTVAAAHAVGESGRVVGVDSSAEMVKRARSDAISAGMRNIQFACEDADRMPYERGMFSAILASMVVGYLKSAARTIHGWQHFLRPDGIIAFSWVQAEDPSWLPVIAAVDGFLPPEHTGWSDRKRWTSAEAESFVPQDMNVHTVTEPVITLYADADHFWRSSWMQAPAIVWANIPLGKRIDARNAAFRKLDELARDDGLLKRTRNVSYTIARLPG